VGCNAGEEDGRMPKWSVYAETRARRRVEDGRVLDRLPALADVLEQYRAIPAGNGSGWSVRLTVDAPEPGAAWERAAVAIGEAADSVGLPRWPYARTEVARRDPSDDGSVPPFPDLVGVSEVARILGVSRQRACALQQHRYFPSPVAVLACGPIWRLDDLRAFQEIWPRRPGRHG
jgi:hypothetical protein